MGEAFIRGERWGYHREKGSERWSAALHTYVESGPSWVFAGEGQFDSPHIPYTEVILHYTI